MITIPHSEYRYTFSRSSGAGGQHVNKTATKVTLHWSVLHSSVLSEEQKKRIQTTLSQRITNQGEIVVTEEGERSQSQNKIVAEKKLQQLIGMALRIPRKRISTKPTKASKEKRLVSKRKRSEVKTNRKMLF